MNKVIPIGCDHAGYALKLRIKTTLTSMGYSIHDVGCNSEESIDYADFGHPVAAYVEKNTCFGIVICGSGNGINMTVNKHAGIRAALCWSPAIAKLAREHNDANILTLPARFLEETDALEIVRVFLETNFEGGRHQTRIEKIPC